MVKKGRKRKAAPKAKPAANQDVISQLVDRISECQRVVDELDGSAVWNILNKDLEVQRRLLDDNWQDITDPLRLQKARELKFATLHILSLKNKYADELKDRQKELKQEQSLDKEILKDYDLETQIEA